MRLMLSLVTFHLCLMLSSLRMIVMANDKLEWKVVDFKSIAYWKKKDCAPKFKDYRVESCISECKKESEWVRRDCKKQKSGKRMLACEVELPLDFLGELRVCVKNKTTTCKRRCRKFQTPHNRIAERSTFTKPNITVSGLSSDKFTINIKESTGKFLCYMKEIEYTLYWFKMTDTMEPSQCKAEALSKNIAGKYISHKGHVSRSGTINSCPNYHAPYKTSATELETNTTYCVFGVFEAKHLENNNGPSDVSYVTVRTKAAAVTEDQMDSSPQLILIILSSCIGAALVLVLIGMALCYYKRFLKSAKQIDKITEMMFQIIFDEKMIQHVDTSDENFREIPDVCNPNDYKNWLLQDGTNRNSLASELRSDCVSNAADASKRNSKDDYIERSSNNDAFPSYIMKDNRHSLASQGNEVERQTLIRNESIGVAGVLPKSKETLIERIVLITSPTAQEGIYAVKDPGSSEQVVTGELVNSERYFGKPNWEVDVEDDFGKNKLLREDIVDAKSIYGAEMTEDFNSISRRGSRKASGESQSSGFPEDIDTPSSYNSEQDSFSLLGQYHSKKEFLAPLTSGNGSDRFLTDSQYKATKYNTMKHRSVVTSRQHGVENVNKL